MHNVSNARWWFAGFLLSLLAASCGEDEKRDNGACDRGEEGCRCNPDDTCDEGLVCDVGEGECVRPGAAGSAGGNGTAGKGGGSGSSNAGRGGFAGGDAGGANAGGSPGSGAGSGAVPAGSAGVGGSVAGESGEGGRSDAGGAGDAAHGGETNASGDGGVAGGGGAGGTAPSGGSGGASNGGASNGGASNGGASNGGGGGAKAGTSGSGGSGASSGSAAGGAGGENGGSAGAGGTAGRGCTSITLSNPRVNTGAWPFQGTSTMRYLFDVDPELGTSTTDVIYLDFHDRTGRDGARTGTFLLGQLGDASFSTCSRCLLVQSDSSVFYFAMSGILTIPSDSLQMSSYAKGTLTNVTLLEAEYVGAELEIVTLGRCLHIASYTFDFEPPVPGWTRCRASMHEDGDCNCGCGAFDPDCEDETIDACYRCFCPGDGGFCDETSVAPDDNAQCLDSTVHSTLNPFAPE